MIKKSININTAIKDELMTIRDIGEKRSGMIIDSVAASLPVVTLYQVNHNRSHKFKNMRSASYQYICFMVLLIAANSLSLS
jgi:hypothetical protein